MSETCFANYVVKRHVILPITARTVELQVRIRILIKIYYLLLYFNKLLFSFVSKVIGTISIDDFQFESEIIGRHLFP